MMTPETLRHARAKATSCAELVSLPLRSRVWKGMAGDFSGAGAGSSLDFQDHRNYLAGDDPRHINWQAYARTGNYTMKLFREEVRPIIELILDVSDSMFFNAVKATRVAEIFYTIVSSAHKAGAMLSIFLVKGNTYQSIPTESVLSDQWFSMISAMQDDSPNQAPTLERILFKTNTIRVFISDLLYPEDPVSLTRCCAQRKGSLIILAPFTQAEANPGWSGNYEFVDPESSSSHFHRIDPGVIKQYKHAYNNHFSLWHNAALRHQAILAKVPAELGLMQALHLDAIKSGALEFVR